MCNCMFLSSSKQRKRQPRRKTRPRLLLLCACVFFPVVFVLLLLSLFSLPSAVLGLTARYFILSPFLSLGPPPFPSLLSLFLLLVWVLLIKKGFYFLFLSLSASSCVAALSFLPPLLFVRLSVHVYVPLSCTHTNDEILTNKMKNRVCCDMHECGVRTLLRSAITQSYTSLFYCRACMHMVVFFPLSGSFTCPLFFSLLPFFHHPTSLLALPYPYVGQAQQMDFFFKISPCL